MFGGFQVYVTCVGGDAVEYQVGHELALDLQVVSARGASAMHGRKCRGRLTSQHPMMDMTSRKIRKTTREQNEFPGRLKHRSKFTKQDEFTSDSTGQRDHGEREMPGS